MYLLHILSQLRGFNFEMINLQTDAQSQLYGILPQIFLRQIDQAVEFKDLTFPQARFSSHQLIHVGGKTQHYN